MLLLFCDSSTDHFTCDTGLSYDTPSQTLTCPNIGTSFFVIDGQNTAGSVNQVLTTNGVAGLKLTPIGGNLSYFNNFFQSGQMPNITAASTITLFSIANQFGIVPELVTMIKCIFNFYVSSASVLVFNLVVTDSSGTFTASSYTQRVSSPGTVFMPINFSYTLGPDYDVTFSITVSSSTGLVSTTTNDFYFVVMDSIQPGA